MSDQTPSKAMDNVAKTGEQAAFLHELTTLMERHKPMGLLVSTFWPPEEAEDEDTVLVVLGVPDGDTDNDRGRATYVLARMMSTAEERARELLAKIADSSSPIETGADVRIRRGGPNEVLQ